MVILDDATFDPTIEVCPKVLVFFTAPWAGPCNLLRPVLESFEDDDSDTAMVEFNLDDNHEIPKRYNIRKLPTLLLLHNGVPAGMKAGNVPREAVEEMLNGP